MRNRRFSVLAPALACSLLLALPAISAAAVPGTSAWRVSGARQLGLVKSHPMTFTLALKPRHQAALSRLVASRHAAVRPAAFMASYAPSVSTVKAVRRWSRAHHLRVSSVSADRMIVRVSGSSAAVARALGTHFANFSSAQSGGFTQITATAHLPKAFASKLSAVLGLSSLSHFAVPKPAVRTATGLRKLKRAAITGPTPTLGTPTVPGLPALPSSLSYPSQYGPKDFWSMYDAPSTATGAGQQLAIITEGDVSQPKADLATFESTFGLPTVAWNQINVGATSTDTSGDDEWDLDSQYSTGFAPGVSTLDVYVGPSLSDQDILNTIDRWVTDDKSQQGSFSAGECELLAYAVGLHAQSRLGTAGGRQPQPVDVLLERGHGNAMPGRRRGQWCPGRHPRHQLPRGQPVRDRRGRNECALAQRPV